MISTDKSTKTRPICVSSINFRHWTNRSHDFPPRFPIINGIFPDKLHPLSRYSYENGYWRSKVTTSATLNQPSKMLILRFSARSTFFFFFFFFLKRKFRDRLIFLWSIIHDPTLRLRKSILFKKKRELNSKKENS